MAKYAWQQNSNWNHSMNPAWGVRLIHKADSRCIRSKGKNYHEGDHPPIGYFPCRKCFPTTNKSFDEAFNATRKGFNLNEE